MITWRYIATRLHGDGTETPLDFDLPIDVDQVHTVMSGHGGLEGKIDPEVEHLRAPDGLPVLAPWVTAIYAEADGIIRGGGILRTRELAGPKLQAECVGHTGYLAGMPYTGHRSIERDDPIKVARHLWDHTQQRAGFNLGIRFAGSDTSRDLFIGDDQLTARVGTATKVTPYVLAYWQTHDLAREFDTLAELAPFEYTITHRWVGETIRHDLTFGYPRLGTRRTDLRFVVGENVHHHPAYTDTGDDYASHVLVLGAGEGRSMMRAESTSTPTRLGRYAIVTDKTITTPTVAQKRADNERAARTGALDLDELTVTNHPNAALGTYQVGDDILLQDSASWAGTRDTWLRILGITINPHTDLATLQVRPAEKAG